MQCNAHVRTFVMLLDSSVDIRQTQDWLIGELSRGFYETCVEPKIICYASEEQI